MPRGDGTGPRGLGSMTGRAAGYCAGYGMPGYANPVFGRGMGFGAGRGLGAYGSRGGGRGWRNVYYATGLPGYMRFGATEMPSIDPEATKQMLAKQAESMEKELDAVRKRISDIEQESANK